MRLALLSAAAPLAAHAFNIVMSNDDGWAEMNIRTFYNMLTAAGQNLVLSGPAENKSGSGSLDATPTPLTSPCQFNSCPAGSPAIGNNASDPRLNYVNAFPVTAMKHGIQTLSSQFFPDASGPDLAVAGPNAGATNMWLAAYFSGTVGAAVWAAQNGVPAVAFSGAAGEGTAFDVPTGTPLYSRVYAELATNLTETLLGAAGEGEAVLPADVWLNVNFPDVSEDECASAGDFKFVMTRIFPGVPLVTKDVEVCGKGGILPWEVDVVGKEGCFVAVSVGDANDKTDSTKESQAVVLERLGGILSCLPE